jgi:hypothetical protein
VYRRGEFPLPPTDTNTPTPFGTTLLTFYSDSVLDR